MFTKVAPPPINSTTSLTVQSLTVNSATSLLGALAVTGSAGFGNISATGYCTITGLITGQAGLSISSATTLTGAVSLGSTLSAVSGATTLAGLTASAVGVTSLTVSSAVTLSGITSVYDAGDFKILNQSDSSKILEFNCSNQTTSTTQTMYTGAQTANRTLSWPVLAASDTIATLGVANTFTATNTFAGINATSIGATTPGTIAATTISASGQITSTLAGGTAPLVVASSTVVANLNVSQLLGNTWAAPGAIGGTTPGSAAYTTISVTGQITSTLAGGTAPIVVTSTTVCANLNAGLLNGTTWTAPGAIGGTTAASGAFTTISATGQITSTLAGGTAPFVVTSSTVVANLNVSQLLGQTWANPGAIGGTTPATTFALSGILTSTNTTNATTSLLGAVVIGNGTAITSIALGGGQIIVGGNGYFGNGSTSATNTSVYVVGGSSGSSNLYFFLGATNQSSIFSSAAAAMGFYDSVNGFSFAAYTAGAVSAAKFTFAGTLDASSSTVAANVMSGGLAVAKQIRNAGACTLDTGANGSSFGGKLTVTGNFACNGSATAAQPTGYGTPTGGALVSSFAAGSITAAQVAAELAQLIVDLKKSGIIGA